MAEEQTDNSILQNIRNEIEKSIDVLTDDVKTLRNISEEKHQDLKQQISSVYQIIEEKLSQIQSIDLNLKDSNQNINDLNARTSSMSDNISSLLRSQNEIKRNIQSLSVDINKIQNDSVNQFNQLNEYTREISKKIAESAKRQERQTREEMVRGPRAAAQASLGITPSAEAKSLQQPEPTQEPESEEKKPRTWTDWFKKNAGLLGAAAGAVTAAGAATAIGPKSAPSGPGYSSSPGEVPSAPPAPNIVGPGVAPGSAPSGPGYSSSPGEGPSAPTSPNIVGSGKEFSAGLAKLRQDQFSKELENGDVLRQLAALEKVEVGSMSEKSKMDWLETLFNRAGVTNSSLMSRLTGRNAPYWGGGIGNPNKVTKEQLESFKARTQEILKGRDVTKGATDNASNDYRSGNLLADSRARKLAKEGRSHQGRWTGGAKDKGEYVYIDSPYVKRSSRYRERMRELDEKLGKSAQSQREPQETAPQPDASRVPPQSQQSQQPDARRESVSEFMKSIRVPERIGYTFKGRTAASGGGMQSRPTNLSEEYVKNRFLPEAAAMMQLGIWPGGENPYFSEADKGELRFDPTGGVKIDPVHKGRSHYGEHGQLAFDMGIGRLSKQLNISRKEAHGIIQDLGSVLRQRVGGKASGSSLIERGQLGHHAHFHYAPQNAALQSAIPELLSNPEKFGRAGQRLIKRLERAGSLKYNQSTSSYELNREKFGKDFLDVYDKFSKAYFGGEGPSVQPEQQERTQQQQFAGNTPESEIKKAIEEEEKKVRKEEGLLTDKQRRNEDGADESKRRNYYNVKELKEGRSQLTPEQQKIFDKMLIRGPFQSRQSAYLKSILGPNWPKKSQQPESSGGISPYIPSPTDVLGRALKSVGNFLFPSAEAAELKPVDKSKIDMTDMPGSLDDGGEEEPRTDNRFNPFSPVTYGKSEKEIREMIELAKKAAEAAENAAKTSPKNSGKGPAASGENNPQPPPARQSPTSSGGNQNGNKKPPESRNNGLHSRAVPSSADLFAEVPYT